MKKGLVAVLCILAFASVCFAETVETVEVANVDRTASEYVPGDLFPLDSFIFDWSDVTDTPTRIVIGGDAAYRWTFWTPTSQVYWRHYLVSDPTGTVKYYHVTSSSLTGNQYNTVTLAPINLPDGDYIMTAVVAGAVSGQGISDPIRFSVRISP